MNIEEEKSQFLSMLQFWNRIVQKLSFLEHKIVQRYMALYPRGSNTKHLLKTYKMEMTGWHARSLIAFHFANYNW